MNGLFSHNILKLTKNVFFSFFFFFNFFLFDKGHKTMEMKNNDENENNSLLYNNILSPISKNKLSSWRNKTNNDEHVSFTLLLINIIVLYLNKI